MHKHLLRKRSKKGPTVESAPASLKGRSSERSCPVASHRIALQGVHGHDCVQLGRTGRVSRGARYARAVQRGTFRTTMQKKYSTRNTPPRNTPKPLLPSPTHYPRSPLSLRAGIPFPTASMFVDRKSPQFFYGVHEELSQQAHHHGRGVRSVQAVLQCGGKISGMRGLE